ncbi:unnamed protein product [Parnassius mnemosyne]|uniref:DUF4776 domain-containing protein n=1 Tax=Parnassius mnemosyne TaxID=213953 RepID=A0AAV1KEK8_9NEOP
MPISDSTFSIEINIEDFISYSKCREFHIRCIFSDVFTIKLNVKDTGLLQNQIPREQTKLLQKYTVRSNSTRKLAEFKSQAVQSILISYDVKHLISKMEKYPILILLRKKSKPVIEFGSLQFRWKELYIDYLKTVDSNQVLLPAVKSTEKYTVLNNMASQPIASFKVTVKLSITKYLSSVKCTTFVKNRPKYSTFKMKDSKARNKMDKLRKLPKGNKYLLTEHKINNDINKEDPLLLAKSRKTFFKDKILSDSKDTPTKKNILNSLVKSATELNKSEHVSVMRSKSHSAIETSKHFNIFNYIFGDGTGPYGNQVYCVGYFTVEADKRINKTSNSQPNKEQSSENSSESRFKYRLCDVQCSNRGHVSDTKSLHSVCSFNLPTEKTDIVNVTQCKQVECNNKDHRSISTSREHQVLLNLDNLNKECCSITEKVEEALGGVTARMKFGKDPCFCTCECTFGFTKKTTYCGVCGGYEKIGEDLARRPKTELPFPCPIFHKIVDKRKLKSCSTSGSDSIKESKKREHNIDSKKRGESLDFKNIKAGSKSGTSSDRRSNVEKKSVGSEKERKKSTRKRKDNKFKFNYGYKAPQIGHSQCAMPCSGKLGTVPKRMGWLWTAENVPGVKHNPQWKPGAIHKFVHRLLKIAKNPGEVVAKKKRKDIGKKKRPLKRPLLVVHKKNGEYTVTMETMKNYSKPRQLNQHPYEDKPVMTYTIGRTEEENRARQKKKEREQRRLERAQRLYLQSAFQDMCHEICLKTYQQALGILPDAEDPQCPCYLAELRPDKINMNVSCSCSEEASSFGSDTDSDEWIVEFTPPNATFIPTFNSKKITKVDNSSQYTYLDFRVKLFDRHGNPIPRFFKGPDGKQQCSDLGGFWSRDHKWLEINVDGYIAPDGRWAPNYFIGPNGETVDTETGKFQANNGKWLVVGVDGFIDGKGRWHFYPKPRSIMTHKKQQRTEERKIGTQHKKETNLNKTLSTWSCFGDASPKKLSTMGIVGHGTDRKLLATKLQDIVAHGKKVNTPHPVINSNFQYSKKHNYVRAKSPVISTNWGTEYFRGKCSHPVPSDKGVEAVDIYGNKTYFRLKEYRNKRPKQRMANLLKQGISLSSFHVPCLHSFISSEIMRKQQRERLKMLAAKHGDTKD